MPGGGMTPPYRESVLFQKNRGNGGLRAARPTEQAAVPVWDGGSFLMRLLLSAA